jgi:hypothetical protein
VYGEVRWSHVSCDDLPLDHESHDFNLYIRIQDDLYYQLNSDANYLEKAWFLRPLGVAPKDWPAKDPDRLMEIEWETKYFDSVFWPVAGDRVWVTGRYIWDCGEWREVNAKLR